MVRKEILRHIEKRQEVLYDLIGNMYNCFGEIISITEEIKYLNYLHEKFKEE